MALLGKTVRLVSAVAATPCEVLEIAHRDYFRKATEKPAACLKLALAIASDVSARMAENRDALRELASRRSGA
jgi:CRP/FNR family transcriptional regulator, cyclic AMP receptor protein